MSLMLFSNLFLPLKYLKSSVSILMKLTNNLNKKFEVILVEFDEFVTNINRLFRLNYACVIYLFKVKSLLKSRVSLGNFGFSQSLVPFSNTYAKYHHYRGWFNMIYVRIKCFILTKLGERCTFVSNVRSTKPLKCCRKQ